LGLYAARRLLAAIPLLLATSFIVFSFLHLAPGSPEQVLLAGKNVNEATRQAIRDHYRSTTPSSPSTGPGSRTRSRAISASRSSSGTT